MSLYRLACRLALALTAGATSTLPWVDRSPTNTETVMTGLAWVVAVVMLASIVARLRLPLLVVEVAAALATVLFVIDGAESVISREQRGASIARTALFTAAGAVIALTVMLDQRRRRTGEEP